MIFDHQPRTRLVVGPGAVERLGELARELSARRVLLVTDAGIAAAGHAERARSALGAIDVVVFDRVAANPTTRDVEVCLAAARAAAPDLLVAVGGGSSIDTAKGVNFLFTNGGRLADYRGMGKAPRPMLPLIAVPTTAGTGSEVQSFALISDEDTHEKMACGDPQAAPRVAVLDPLLTLSQPREVAAACGMDTVVHAFETAVTTARNPYSLLFSREAFRLADAALPAVLERPADVGARGEMQLAAAFAGMAIEASMLGAAHAAANPLTALFDVVHGRAVGMMLPAVVRKNAEDEDARRGYQALAAAAGLAPSVEALLARLEVLLSVTGTPRPLAHYRIARDDLPALAREAAGQMTARYNPVRMSERDFQSLYEAVY